jgi:hypothetical protein
MKTRNFLRRHKKSRKTKFRNTRKTYSGKQKGGKLVMYIGNRNLSNLGYREKKIFSGKDGIIIEELNKIAGVQNGGLFTNPFSKETKYSENINTDIPTFQAVSNTEEKKEKLKDLLQKLNMTTRTKLLKAIYTMTIMPIMNPVMDGDKLNINESFSNILSNHTSEDMVVCFDFKNLNTNMSSELFNTQLDIVQTASEQIVKEDPDLKKLTNKIEAYNKILLKNEQKKSADELPKGGSTIDNLSKLGSVVGFKTLNESIHDALIKIYGNENSEMANDYMNYMKSQGYLSSKPPAKIYFYNDCIYVYPDIISIVGIGGVFIVIIAIVISFIITFIFSSTYRLFNKNTSLIKKDLSEMYEETENAYNFFRYKDDAERVVPLSQETQTQITGKQKILDKEKIFIDTINKLPTKFKLFILYGFDPKTYEEYVGMDEKVGRIVQTLKAIKIDCETPLSKDQFRYNMLKYYAEMED